MFQSIFSSAPLTHGKALIYIAFAAFLWSTSGLFIKLIALNPLAIAGLRSAIAALFVILLMRGSLHFNFSRPQLAGAVAYALTMILFVVATKTTTAANAILLQYTAPVSTALLGAWLLKEKVNRFDWAIIALVFSGMALFFFDKISPIGFWGNIMAVASGVTMSYFVICMRIQKDASPLETVIMGNLLTALLCLPFYFQQAPAAIEWAILLYMGVLQIGFSFLLFSKAIKYVAALESILIQTIDPLLNPIWVWLIIGEIPGRWAILGGIVVVGSVTLRSIISNKKALKAETGIV
jgi:drug/metabolite transporter (DMT)-like permease